VTDETTNPPDLQPTAVGVEKSASSHDGPAEEPERKSHLADQEGTDPGARGPEPEDAVDKPIDGFSAVASELYYTQINKYLVDLERFSRLKAKQGA
jgi:hypothetical protein